MATREQTQPSPRSGLVQRSRRQPDAVIRLTHAAMALAFLGAWLTAGWRGLLDWHVAWGHVLAVAWLGRVGWSLAEHDASLRHLWRDLTAARRRLRARAAGALRPATWSIAARAALASITLALVPACFVSGWALGRVVEVSPGAIEVHRWLGTALMVGVAAHMALAAVLGVLRGRCVLCTLLPGGSRRPGRSGDGLN